MIVSGVKTGVKSIALNTNVYYKRSSILSLLRFDIYGPAGIPCMRNSNNNHSLFLRENVVQLKNT